MKLYGNTASASIDVPSANLAEKENGQPKQHLGYLDSLRALAALYVCSTHAKNTIWEGNTATLSGLSYILAWPFRFGHFAVGLFIVLSGFCLMLPVVQGDGYLRGSAFQFFIRRARRILPPYYAALGCSLLLIFFAIGHQTGSGWDFRAGFKTCKNDVMLK